MFEWLKSHLTRCYNSMSEKVPLNQYLHVLLYNSIHTHTHTQATFIILLSIESMVVEVTQCSLQSCRGGGVGWGWMSLAVQSALKRPVNIDLSVGEGVWGWGGGATRVLTGRNCHYLFKTLKASAISLAT